MASVTSNASPSERPLNAVLPIARSRSAKDFTRSRSRLSSGTRPSCRPSWNSRCWLIAAILRAARGARKTAACDDRGRHARPPPHRAGPRVPRVRRALSRPRPAPVRARLPRAGRPRGGRASWRRRSPTATWCRSGAASASCWRRWGRGPRGRSSASTRGGWRSGSRASSTASTTGATSPACCASSRACAGRTAPIESFFAPGHAADAPDVGAALTSFAERALALDHGGLYGDGPLPARAGVRFFFSSPADGSACKRLNLFLRWMVRREGVDLGVWRAVEPRALVIPLDAHVTRSRGACGSRATARRAGRWRSTSRSACAASTPSIPSSTTSRCSAWA